MIKKSRLRWFGHVEQKDDNDWVKRCITWEVAGIRQRGCPKKTWWDCVKNDIESFRLSPQKRMRSSRINGGELKGQLANLGLPGEMADKTVCVCVCVYTPERSSPENFVHVDNTHPFLKSTVLGQNYANCSRDFMVILATREVPKQNPYYPLSVNQFSPSCWLIIQISSKFVNTF